MTLRSMVRSEPAWFLVAIVAEEEQVAAQVAELSTSVATPHPLLCLTSKMPMHLELWLRQMLIKIIHKAHSKVPAP